MVDIVHRVGIKAPIGDVYTALSTREGIASWWTSEVTGESTQGGELAFGFGFPEPAAVMSVTELTEPATVEWRCDQGPDDWKGTTISFELKENGEETVLDFHHAGWRQPVEFMHHCSTKWAYFLLGLKSGLEGGSATPWPNDLHISSWG